MLDLGDHAARRWRVARVTNAPDLTETQADQRRALPTVAPHRTADLLDPEKTFAHTGGPCAVHGKLLSFRACQSWPCFGSSRLSNTLRAAAGLSHLSMRPAIRAESATAQDGRFPAVRQMPLWTHELQSVAEKLVASPKLIEWPFRRFLAFSNYGLQLRIFITPNSLLRRAGRTASHEMPCGGWSCLSRA